MTYIQGFVIPVRLENKQAYLDLATRTAPMFAEFGALRTVECWGEDVPHGKRTDFYRAVKADEGESIVFSWIIWPDKATCDAAAPKLQTDPRMNMPAEIPFDGKRMIYAGFDVASDSGDGGKFGWIDGMVATVKTARRQELADHAAFMQDALKGQGALRTVNGWGVDVPDGTTTDFKRAVEAETDETVLFGWIEWPDKAAHDAGWAKLMADGTMQRQPPVWDGARAIFGGFTPILDTDHA